MEEFIGAATGGVVWGIGFAAAMGVVRAMGTGLRPAAKGAMRGGFAVVDWVRNAAEQTKEGVEDLYHEAKAEREEPA